MRLILKNNQNLEKLEISENCNLSKVVIRGCNKILNLVSIILSLIKKRIFEISIDNKAIIEIINKIRFRWINLRVSNKSLVPITLNNKQYNLKC